MSTERVEKLLETLEANEHILIVTHNDPDPDAIAAAVALRKLLQAHLEITPAIVYRGLIGRAENRALVSYLERPLRRLKAKDLTPGTAVALVDTQPGAGNNPIRKSTQVTAVIDHHPLRAETENVPFVDVREDVGATSTILTTYLLAADIEPSPQLATVLFYGIKTDTLGLSRHVSELDKNAYFYLQPRIETSALVEIERAQVPATYFRSFAQTLQAARIYDDIVIAHIGEMRYPDLGAELADLLLRLRGTNWVILTGTFKDHLLIAVRSRRPQGSAGRVAREIINGRGSAGGHGAMAGGQIPLHGADGERLAGEIRRNALQHLGKPPDMEGERLI